jgi:hypothetical protein
MTIPHDCEQQAGEAGTPKPWERQPQEPAQAYAKFSYYLQLGPGRSLGQVAQAFGISPQRVRELSARWRWTPRAAAWQTEVARRRREQERAQAQAARQRHLQDAVHWQRFAGLQIMSWVRRNQNGEFELVRDLSPREAMRLYRAGYRAERLLRGGAEEEGDDQAVSEELVLAAEVEELERSVHQIIEGEFIPAGLRDTPLERLRLGRLLARLLRAAHPQAAPRASRPAAAAEGIP